VFAIFAGEGGVVLVVGVLVVVGDDVVLLGAVVGVVGGGGCVEDVGRDNSADCVVLLIVALSTSLSLVPFFIDSGHVFPEVVAASVELFFRFSVICLTPIMSSAISSIVSG